MRSMTGSVNKKCCPEVTKLNEKFFHLPQEKQQAIINMGYRVFSQNTYKKSPMSEIAAAAGISKALLFHYFTNKRELYLFLWQKSTETTIEYLQKYDCYAGSDVFEIMLRGLQAKVAVIKDYPYLSAFVMRAYYEKDPEVAQELHKLSEKFISYKENTSLLKMDPADFIPGLDLRLMYQDMYWASEGYLLEKQRSGNLDADEMERDFIKMIDFWKSIYKRRDAE